MIKIMNMKTDSFEDKPWQFRCDRSSPVGNKLYLQHEADRDYVCEEYQIQFDNMMISKSEEGKKFQEYIKKLVDAYDIHDKLELFCWCTPKRCHVETIREYIYSYINWRKEHEANGREEGKL